MSELIFVRHGQASFGEASYDKLSERGVEQIQLLAQHWLDLGEQFDCIYSGTLLRQKETANGLLSVVKNQQSKSYENPDFNEYNGDSLIKVYLRDHSEGEGFDPLVEWPIRDERLFQQLFEAATAKWINNKLQPASQDNTFEHWDSFQNRVHSIIDEIMQKHTGGSKVLISTSGGVIAMAMQRVLQFPDEKVITTNWMVHNSSVTRIKYGNGKVSLTQFNSLAHLEKEGMQHMVTYR